MERGIWGILIQPWEPRLTSEESLGAKATRQFDRSPERVRDWTHHCVSIMWGACSRGAPAPSFDVSPSFHFAKPSRTLKRKSPPPNSLPSSIVFCCKDILSLAIWVERDSAIPECTAQGSASLASQHKSWSPLYPDLKRMCIISGILCCLPWLL